MKTTLELPDSLFRRAKLTATRRGQTMTAFITSAVEAKLQADKVAASEKPWMAFAGVFSDDLEESRRINQTIEEGCEQIDPRDWS